MKVNWKVRFANKTFWLTIIPAILLLVQTILAVFGITIDLTELGNRILDVVNALFMVLMLMGVINDPTTVGLGDSERAMTYTVPSK